LGSLSTGKYARRDGPVPRQRRPRIALEVGANLQAQRDWVRPRELEIASKRDVQLALIAVAKRVRTPGGRCCTDERLRRQPLTRNGHRPIGPQAAEHA